MASKGQRQFKHPIPTSAGKVNDGLQRTDAQQLVDAYDLSDRYSMIVWNGLKIAVRDMISNEEASILVALVLDECWNGEGYLIEEMDFALRCAVITFYSTATLPDDNELRYKFVYKTDLYETIRERINEGQIAAIEEAVKMYLAR